MDNHKISELVDDMLSLYNQAANIIAVGESGGGFVKVTVNGHFKIIKIDYENSPLITSDLCMYNDLVIAACNVAMDKVSQMVSTTIKGSIG